MKKLAVSLLAAMVSVASGFTEVESYAHGLERVEEDGWVLLCHSADWDSTHDEQWMRRQTSIRSACGNAMVLYIPVYQSPTQEQAEQVERQLRGSLVDLSQLKSVPCAILLDRDGRPYATISGDDFTERAAGLIRTAQSQLRTRSSLIRQAALEEGSQKAQTLSRIWRLNITPPPNLQEMMHHADPQDTANIAEWSPFDPWALAERIRTMPYEAAITELDRVLKAQLSKEERQAVLAIRMGYVHHHLGTAGVTEIRQLAHACASLAPGTPLGKAAQRAATLWGSRISLSKGWQGSQLPLQEAECELSGVLALTRNGEFHLGIVPTGGDDPVRITRVTLYDGETKLSEDAHTCSLKAGEPPHEYMLILRYAPTHPRLVITFDQQGKRDTTGYFTLRHRSASGQETIILGRQHQDSGSNEVSKHSTLDKFEDTEPKATSVDAAEATPKSDAAPASSPDAIPATTPDVAPVQQKAPITITDAAPAPRPATEAPSTPNTTESAQ